MSMLKMRLTAVALTASGALLLLPASGLAAQTFGSRLINDPTTTNCKELGPCTVVSFIHPIDPNGDPYSGGAPSSGVITKFEIRYEAPAPTPVTFRVAGITPEGPPEFNTATATAAGTGPTVTLEATAENAVTRAFPAHLPVKMGQHLAMDATSAKVVYDPNGKHFSYAFAPQLVGGRGAASSEPTGELLVRATLEPDADGDGFGDETQDLCPSQATTQGACDRTAPTVSGLRVSGGKIAYKLSEPATVGFLLAKRTSGRRVRGKCVAQTAGNRSKPRCPRFKTVGRGFTGPGNAGANQLALPNGRRLTPGFYRLTMTVRDVAGNKATRTTSFQIKRKKRKK